MEDEKETEKVDEHETDKQEEERGTSFIYPAADSLKTFRSLEQFVVHRQRIYCLTVPSVKCQGAE